MVKRIICLILVFSFITAFSGIYAFAENENVIPLEEADENNQIPEGMGVLEILPCTEGSMSRNVGRHNYSSDIDDVLELKPNIGYHVYGVEIDGEFTALEGNTVSIPVRVGKITSVRPVFRGNVTFNIKQTEGGNITPEGTIYIGTGTYIDVCATPDPGYICTGIFVDNVDIEVTKEGNLYKASYKADREKEYQLHALFEPTQPHTATLTQNEGGKVLPFDEEGKASVLSGETAQFQILPDEGYGIKSVKINGKDFLWTADGIVSYPNVTTDLNVVVEFSQMESIPVIITTSGKGTVTSATKAYINSTLFLEFTPDEGRELVSVHINGERQQIENNMLKLFITEEMKELSELKIDVVFDITVKKYKIRTIVQSSIGGTITAEGFVISNSLTYVRSGDSIVLTFTPDMNYVIKQVTIDEIPVELSEGNTYTLSNVNSDHNVLATFVPISSGEKDSLIEVEAGKGGTISPSGNQPVNVGEKITFTFTPNEGYILDYIVVDGNEIDLEDDTYTMEGGIENRSIKAIFKKIESTDVDLDKETIEIDITTNPIVSTTILENIKADGKDKLIIFKGNDFIWKIPSAELKANKELDLSVVIGKDDASQELLEKLEQKMVNKGIPGLYNQIIKTSGVSLPEGTKLIVNLGSNAKGKILDYLYYNYNTGTFDTVIEDEDSEVSPQVTVGYDGKVELAYKGNKYLILYVYSGSTYKLKVEIEGKGNSDYRKPNDGWNNVSIKDPVDIQITPDPGYKIDSIMVNGAAISNEFIGSTKAFTLSLGRLDKDTVVKIIFTEADSIQSSDEDPITNDVLSEGGIKPWVVALIIIGIALIGGVALFIYKWNEEKDIVD